MHPPFDQEALLASLGGDRDLAQTIVRSALGDLPGYCDRLEQAVAAGNWKNAGSLAHTLKGLTAQIGGTRLSRRLQEIDGELRAGGEVDAATMGELRIELRILVAALNGWMDQ